MTRNFWICLFNKSQLLLNSSFLISVWEKEQFVRKKINKPILVFQLIQHYKISLLRLLWRKIINENEDIERFLVKNNLNNWKKHLAEHIIRMWWCEKVNNKSSDEFLKMILLIDLAMKIDLKEERVEVSLPIRKNDLC